MVRAKLKFRLHRAAIVLICLALLVALMQGASWFSQSSQRQHNPQMMEELAPPHTLAHQVTLNPAPLMRAETPDENKVTQLLRQLTTSSRLLDASVYGEEGNLIAHAGESLEVRDRLALDGKKAGGSFNQQLVEPIQGKNEPLGYLHLTPDPHTLATDAKQVDNATTIPHLMLLFALATGAVPAQTLLQGKRSRWQRTPFLLWRKRTKAKSRRSDALIRQAGPPSALPLLAAPASLWQAGETQC